MTGPAGGARRNNGLNEALEALEALDDWEFATRMGGTKDEVRQLLADIKAGSPGDPLTLADLCPEAAS